MDNIYKEVYFNQYCKTCEYKNLKESEEPCDECLSNPINEYSHKPINYKEKEKTYEVHTRRIKQKM